MKNKLLKSGMLIGALIAGSVLIPVDQTVTCNVSIFCSIFYQGDYPTKTYKSIEEGNRVQPKSNDHTFINDSDFYSADTNYIKSLENVVRIERDTFLYESNACGCRLKNKDRNNYLGYYGVDADGNKLLGPNDLIARPCPPHCYGG